MNRKWILAVAVFFLGGLINASVYAEEPGLHRAQLRKESQEAIKTQKEAMKANAKAAKAEERQLRGQIHQAKVSGNMEAAHQLKTQLKETHSENIEQRKQDKKELKKVRHEAKKEWKGPYPTKREWQGPRQYAVQNWKTAEYATAEQTEKKD